MEMGIVGLGRMGSGIAERLLRAGHVVVAYDPSAAALDAAQTAGAKAASSLADIVRELTSPRVVWVMVPAGAPTEDTLNELAKRLAPGDIVIDGGNSNYRDTQRRATGLAAREISMLDIGTSGGVWGRDEGYCLMVGGDAAAVAHVRPVLEALAPAADRGWGHVGPTGAGHFVKMIHNGIEYGLMQAYAEGFSVLKHKTELDLDLSQIAEVWRHGSVVRSWLLDLTQRALEEHGDLDDIAPWVADSGEGRWTVEEAIALDVPAPVMTLALIQRLRSRDAESFGDRLLAAMRQQFGGHAVRGGADAGD